MSLQPHPTIPPADGPVLVCILDGFGENAVKDEYNAVHAAATPVYDKLRAVEGRWRGRPLNVAFQTFWRTPPRSSRWAASPRCRGCAFAAAS